MLGSTMVSVLIGTFVASCVEVTEMVIIVVGVGATRGWRSTWIGVGAGLIVLVGIIAGLGQALQLIPIDLVRVIIGALLLTFGLQWYRKGVIQVAADGFTGGQEEDGADEAGAGGGGGIDWTAFVLSFKGVLLEGLEVAFIVVAFGAGGSSGSNSSDYLPAYIGAGAAFVVIGAIGLIAKRQLERVPGRTLKFGVGGLLSTFGTFWALEGLGVHWPAGDLSLAWLYAVYLGSTFVLMRAVRDGLLGPAPESARPDPAPEEPTPAATPSTTATPQPHPGRVAGRVAGPRRGARPASELRERRGEPADRWDGHLLDPSDPEQVRRFQRRHRLLEDGIVGPKTQAAMRSVRYARAAEREES